MRKIVLIMVLLLLMPLSEIVHADSGGYIVKFNTDISDIIDTSGFKIINKELNIYLVNNIDEVNDWEQYIVNCTENEVVELIEPFPCVEPMTLPTDELYNEQWQLQMVNADAAWNIETYGNNIKIAVIDSGCYQHEDLKNNLFEGWNYLDNNSDTTDNNGHGTHVCGIIAAENNDIGIVGVAPKSKIVPLKCFDPNSDTYADILISAIYDAVDKYECDIINMSWGLKSDNPLLSEAINYAYNKGVILIAAVGNYGTTTMYYPAAYENVIGVSSVGLEKNKSSFAQYNKSVLVTAPGELVYSTYKNGDYVKMQGTSQAAPVVSGLAAVALSVKEDLTNTEFDQLLISTAEDLGEPDYDIKFGYGLVDEQALVNRLLENISCYVSPINSNDENAYVLIKNNTESILKATSIFSRYNNNKFVGCSQKEITLLPQKDIKIQTNISSNNIAHFLWRGFESMKPLTLKRERK